MISLRPQVEMYHGKVATFFLVLLLLAINVVYLSLTVKVSGAEDVETLNFVSQLNNDFRNKSPMPGHQRPDQVSTKGEKRTIEPHITIFDSQMTSAPQLEPHGARTEIRERTNDPVELLSSVSDFWEGSKQNRTICASWDTDVDSWWLSHPDWYPSLENARYYCFSPIRDQRKAAFMKRLYDNQYKGNCSNVLYREVLSYGWGIDFLNVVDLLYKGLRDGKPIKMVAKKPWHYALPNTPENLLSTKPTKVCESADMDCFFLPLSPCPPWTNGFPTLKYKIIREKKILRVNGTIYKNFTHWLLEYTKRPQHWLRKRIFDFVDRQNVTAPCTAMHVRRGDVLLDDNARRRYYPIDDYVKAVGPSAHQNIFLITDDANAITEAEEKFPNLTWQYIDRPRYRGSEAGFAKHTPSGDGSFEVVVLMSLSRLVKRCDQLVRAVSGFSDYLWNQMIETNAIKNVQYFVQEDGSFGKELEAWDQSLNISRAFEHRSG